MKIENFEDRVYIVIKNKEYYLTQLSLTGF